MRKGFTLVELLIVIIIIGILATMAIPQYTKMVDKAKRVEAISNVSSIGTGSILYYVQYGKVTGATADLDVTVDTSKWTYAGTTADTSMTWTATRVGDTSKKVRVAVIVPSGNKAIEYTTNGGAASSDWTSI